MIKNLQKKLQAAVEEKDTFLAALLANKATQAEALDSVNEMHAKVREQQKKLDFEKVRLE